jgi:hypothetical protein
VYIFNAHIKPVKDNETLDTIFIIVNIVISNLFIFFLILFIHLGYLDIIEWLAFVEIHPYKSFAIPNLEREGLILGSIAYNRYNNLLLK